jgi:hypothetical protein
MDANRRLMLAAAAAFALGVFAGYVDLGATEEQPAALVIITSAFLVSLAVGRRPWLMGLLAGIGVALVAVVARLAGRVPQPELSVAGLVLPCVVGLVGAYAGYGARKLLNSAMSSL